jgi:hypothetical protein
MSTAKMTGAPLASPLKCNYFQMPSGTQCVTDNKKVAILLLGIMVAALAVVLTLVLTNVISISEIQAADWTPLAYTLISIGVAILIIFIVLAFIRAIWYIAPGIIGFIVILLIVLWLVGLI